MTEPMSTESTDITACCGTHGPGIDPEQASVLAESLGALADPVRLQILSIIAASDAGEVCACDFVGPIDRSQPTVSHHLKVLSDAGLVTGDKRGRWVWYRLAPNRLDVLLAALADATSAGGRPSQTTAEHLG